MADLQQLVAQQRQLEEELDIQHMVAEQKRLEEDKVDTNPSGCDTPTIAKVVMATPNKGASVCLGQHIQSCQQV